MKFYTHFNEIKDILKYLYTYNGNNGKGSVLKLIEEIARDLGFEEELKNVERDCGWFGNVAEKGLELAFYTWNIKDKRLFSKFVCLIELCDLEVNKY